MIQYQDLGLNLRVTPQVTREGDVSLSIDLSIDGLSGSSIDGNPILNNEAFSGVVTLKRGQGVEVASELSRSESRAISGTPGVAEIPGMNDLASNDNQQNYATLLILITPHVIRETQAAGHTPMTIVEQSTPAQ
jgi:type II secretory pathway component GspD/PulD (secretin)